MCRWSKDSASVVTWRTHDLVVHDPRLLLDRAEAQDRRLARVDDRGARVDAEDTHVGDRERAAAHLGRLRLPFAGDRRQLVQRGRQLEEREVLRFLDVGHDQPARGGRGDAEVDVVLEHDLLGGLVPERVDLRRPPHRQDHGAGEHQQRRDLDVAELASGLEPVDELHGPGGVDGDPLGDVRRGERRLHHRAGHHLADALDRLTRLALARARRGVPRPSVARPRPGCPRRRRA